ncbi:MAG TPA: SagB/ThcOx family dehydrogenase [Blastocatellia bacterium]|nr:SagB/ThcOx family dehydrogenase [Blastocatellia bacterium]
MQNRDTESAQRYHDLTKHSYWSIRSSPHYLDWANRPSPFKIYPGLEPIPLPRAMVQTLAPSLEVVASTGVQFAGEKSPDLERLASILYYSAGVTKHKTYPGGELYFRAAACAGALYPTEVYVVCGDIEGLTAGVYHFNPGDFALRQLRGGDCRGVLARASGEEHSVVSAPVTLVFTSISWRSTWKYRDRAYRYHFWDNGMIAANALAMSAAHELPARIVMGFVEADLNKLIGIDGEQELALSLLALGHGAQGLPDCPAIEKLPEIDFEVVPISASPVDYPSIREAHSASSFTERHEVRDWRNSANDSRPPAVEVEEFPLVPIEEIPEEAIEDVIQRRASTRRFARKAMPFGEFSTIIDRATRGIPTDFLSRDAAPLNDIYAIVNRVEGVPPGAYYHRRADRTLELLKPGDFNEKAAYLTLDQQLGGDACVTLFLMSDLKGVLGSYGNRGYRAAQMEAGIIGGKVYLASYALKRGATGLTFYDDDVTAFLGPHAAGKSCMLVVAVGIPGKRPLI